MLFGSPDEREFDHDQDNGKASRVDSIFERDVLEGKIQIGH